jgi:hypothetical protein
MISIEQVFSRIDEEQFMREGHALNYSWSQKNKPAKEWDSFNY